MQLSMPTPLHDSSTSPSPPRHSLSHDALATHVSTQRIVQCHNNNTFFQKLTAKYEITAWHTVYPDNINDNEMMIKGCMSAALLLLRSLLLLDPLLCWGVTLLHCRVY